MDAFTSETTNFTYSGPDAPVLLAATSASAMARAERTVDASGFRIGARLHIDEAVARIKSQPAAAQFGSSSIAIAVNRRTSFSHSLAKTHRVDLMLLSFRGRRSCWIRSVRASAMTLLS